MACCNLNCLKFLVFVIAIVILVIAGIGPIIFGAVYYNSRLAEALELEAEFLGTSVALGVYVCLFSILGICGACKVHRYCLCWYFIFLIQIFVFCLAMLIFFILLVTNGEDELKRYCNNQSGNNSYGNFNKLRRYDDVIQNVGNPNYLCGTNCLCQTQSSSTTFNYQYSQYENLNTINPGNILVHSSSGVRKTQDCSNFNNMFDRTERALIEIMGEVENRFKCSGVCYTSNTSVAYDSTNS